MFHTHKGHCYVKELPVETGTITCRNLGMTCLSNPLIETTFSYSQKKGRSLSKGLA